MRHYCAELGGNAPVVVFADSQLDAAVNGAAFGAFVAAGQTCVSAKRLLIEDSIYDEFVSKLVAKVEGFVLGNQLETTPWRHFPGALCLWLPSWFCPTSSRTCR